MEPERPSQVKLGQQAAVVSYKQVIKCYNTVRGHCKVDPRGAGWLLPFWGILLKLDPQRPKAQLTYEQIVNSSPVARLFFHVNIK